MWDQVLLQAKFSYNDSMHRITRKSPFEIIYDTHPRGLCELRVLRSHEERSGHAKDFLSL